MAKVACLHCDLLLDAVPIERGEKAVCPRCHQTLYLDQRSFKTALALLMTALLMYFPAILLPFINLEVKGSEVQISLLSSISAVSDNEMFFLAMAVFVLVVFFPLIKFTGLLLVMIPLWRGYLPFGGTAKGMMVIRYILSTSPWSMVEVYLVGVLVALVKLAGVANIELSEGFFAFLMLIVANTMLSIKLPQHRIWYGISSLKEKYEKEKMREALNIEALLFSEENSHKLP